MTDQTADRPFAAESTEVLRAALGLATRHAEQATRFRPTQPDGTLPAVVDLLNAELQHREETLLPTPEGPEYTPCSSCTHIEPEHQPDAGPCMVCDCRAYEPAAVSAAAAPVLPSPADTAPGDESPHVYLTSIRHQAGHAHDFTKAGRMVEALEHVEAIERLLGVYRRAVGAPSVVPADVLRVLARLANPEACRWEGVYCITHSWRSDTGTCPHGEAQQLLGGAA